MSICTATFHLAAFRQGGVATPPPSSSIVTSYTSRQIYNIAFEPTTTANMDEDLLGFFIFSTLR